jgi:acetylornithine/succinyldiaminopimelate/putrescine aminotransferase
LPSALAVVRITPPLNIEPSEIEFGVSAMEQALAAMRR